MRSPLDTLERDIAEVLDTRIAPHVRIIGGALDEDSTSPTGLIACPARNGTSRMIRRERRRRLAEMKSE